MRYKLFKIIESAEEGNKLSAAYDYFIMAVIVASLLPLAFKKDYAAFHIIDMICVAIFAVDYILRWITADYKFGKKSVGSFLRYPFSFMAIVDLVSVLPSVTTLNRGFKVLRIFRMFRALRVFRVLKAFRYSKSLQIISRVFKKSKHSLMAVGTFAVAYIIISALVVFNVEPDSFANVFDAIYWATVSLTTVGYGDIYPITDFGRVVTMISSLFGIAIVALPAGIITAGYMKELDEQSEPDDSAGEKQPVVETVPDENATAESQPELESNKSE